ncbi:MAG: nitroreductase family protein [Clostridia bacterium]|nr:nitroreductase family protein [Clostridia bacterium]
MEFERLIAERYSVRKFKPEPLSEEAIGRILKAGHLAPTGCNAQPQRILVLNTPEGMEKLRGCTKCHFGAPAAMLVCYNVKESWIRPYDGALSAPVDAAIVTTHLMLAAHDAGVGSCWVMHFDPAALRRSFAIPEDYIPLALLVMGYPAEDSAPFPMHSSFRDESETVFFEHF